MPGWNQQLFLLINASSNPNAWLAQLAEIVANSPTIVGPVLLVTLWVWGQPSNRGGLLSVTGGMLIGLGINQFLGFLYFEPRPFMIGLGQTLLSHVPDNSFPSDHATFVWALGAGLIMTGTAWQWGTVVCLYGAGVAWSRVYLGVHFPIDMIASIPVAIVSGCIAWIGQHTLAMRVVPLADGLYEAALRALRVPPALAPRRLRNKQATVQK